ncbi:MAG: hypothetical protein P0S93_00165, partial [Candidatus Neptunochlamydia sp.]|nr:hypothetical protein [Candidatus Neptunochlamydia sp.]
MSAITCTQPKGGYNFSIEKPTQSEKNIAIEQTSEGLKIFVKDGLKIVQVKRCLVEGLPKVNLVPKGFFDACHVALKNIGGESKVAFFPSLKGGMMRSNQGVLKFDFSKEDFPSDKTQVTKFLSSSHIKELSRQNLNQGHSTLIDLVSYAQTGAKALSISSTAAHNLGHAQEFYILRYDYNDLLERSAIIFTEMQSTNISIIIKLISACLLYTSPSPR